MNAKELYLQKIQEYDNTIDADKEDKLIDELDELWLQLTEEETLEVNHFVMELNLSQ